MRASVSGLQQRVRLAYPIMPTLSFLALAACGPDPALVHAQTYLAEVQPLLAENAELARAFRDMAAEIKRREASAEGVGADLSSRLLPAARLLEQKAEAINPGSAELEIAHRQLIGAWTTRRESYEAVLVSWRAEDLAAFDAALELRMEGRNLEARHFASVQSIIAPLGLNLVAYPKAAVTP
jgi:hypothetical protein